METSTIKNNNNNNGTKFIHYVGIPLLLTVIIAPFALTINAGHPLSFMYPSFLLVFGPGSAVQPVWQKVVVDPTEEIEPVHIAEMDASEYSFEHIKKATKGWTVPVVIRGLFKNTTAVAKWAQDGYLNDVFGDYKIRAIHLAKYPAKQNNRTVMRFDNAMNEILANKQSRLYLFFPILSRNYTQDGEGVEPLQLRTDVNQIVLDDLEVDKRIFPGYGTKSHWSYLGSQILIGNGQKERAKTTGTRWHCAQGDNWFIQVKGTKLWYFLHSKYGPYLHIKRAGKFNMDEGRDMEEMQKYLPVSYTMLHEGDVLYNPEWQLHKIANQEGLSIGVATRDLDLRNSFANNALFSLTVIMNLALEKTFGYRVGGYGDS